MGKKYKKDHARAKAVEATLGGLIGVSVVMLIQLLSIPTLDAALTVSLYSVSVSIPLASAALLCEMAENHFTFTEETWYSFLVIASGSLSTAVAIGAVFYHFSRLAAGLFTILSFSGFFLWGHHVNVVKRANTP